MEKIEKWKEKYTTSKNHYEDVRKNMDIWDAYYNGTRKIGVRESFAKKQATIVRNIVYELVESQVDSSIPQPKVTAIHEDDRELAKKIEFFLQNELDRLPFEEMNDLDERVSLINGGDFYEVYWSSKERIHTATGSVGVRLLNPRRVIPQAGVTDIDDMDYLFVITSRSKESIKREFGKDVKTEGEDDPTVRGPYETQKTADDLVTQVTAYYKNGESVGKFSWCDDVVLEDYPDYLSRRVERCAVCGAVKTGKVCECGSRKFITREEQFEELLDNLELPDGTEIPKMTQGEDIPALNPDGTMQTDETTGEPILMPSEEKTRIPYYKPDVYPIVLRRNVTMPNSFLGGSDVEHIKDHQDSIKKTGTRMEEKINAGGSIVTLPDDVAVETTDSELKVVRLATPAQKNLIDVYNLQPDISKDLAVLNANYDWAKSTTGVTDSYQGKYDASATSGTAKQFSAQQAAGRMESKRRMKNSAYARLFELMFKFWLAYSDESVPVMNDDSSGVRYDEMNRYEFLRKDAAGEFYWDDEFLFDVDSTGLSASNRGAMWNDAKANLQMGAFGNLGDIDTLIRYWGFMDDMHYPKAKSMKTMLEQAKEDGQSSQMTQPIQPTLKNPRTEASVPNDSWATDVAPDEPNMPAQEEFI